ncbi:HAD family phosphatase [Deinococcus psychrotolerans]|uniref:HAD family phosphatase n=1 Tax=Deinococcus psychrotolerans TaxID=2489213 RepID=A0A3G8YAH1_9DEIO|nr:HAD family phosphatase [Deinococcus psychrotolerans]AZI42388.1 HAD family phosphatase [Deinococcus psychrotolerans]
MIFDAVLFDMDGVLVDSEVVSGQVWVQTLGDYGLTLDHGDYMARAVGHTASNLYASLERDHAWKRTPEFEHALTQRLAEAFAKVEEVPGAQQILKALKAAGVPFAVASNSTRDKLQLKLKATGLAELLGAHAYDPSTVSGLGKPLPDLYLHAAEQLGVDIQRCVVVEDSLSGLAAGLSAGATGWGFAGGGHQVDADALLEAGAERVVNSHAELRQLLGI